MYFALLFAAKAQMMFEKNKATITPITAMIGMCAR
jgi:hypothetical protein